MTSLKEKHQTRAASADLTGLMSIHVARFKRERHSFWLFAKTLRFAGLCV